MFKISLGHLLPPNASFLVGFSQPGLLTEQR
jgi:hypothetical protein